MTKTPPGEGGALSKNDSKDFDDHAVVREDTPTFRRLSNIEAIDLRRIWWHQVASGHRLPAEPGIIIIDGDMP